MPSKYIGVPLALIETPGKSGKKIGIESQIIGIITFSSCYQYKTKAQWESDVHLHLVNEKDSSFQFTKTKWAWVISEIRSVPKQNAPKIRGIKYAKDVQVTL